MLSLRIKSMKLTKRKIPRLKDFDYSSSHVYFITSNTHEKKSYFIERDFNREVIECLKEKRNVFEMKIFVYCLMPDHFHLLLQPSGKGASVSDFIGAFKGKVTALKRKRGIEGKLWQSRFHDHILRKNEDITEVARYILNNPVRRGLVEVWEDYEFCCYLDEFD